MMHHIIILCPVCQTEEELLSTSNQMICGHCGRPSKTISEREYYPPKESNDADLPE